jgi:PAS domain S-box-containing protein
MTSFLSTTRILPRTILSYCFCLLAVALVVALRYEFHWWFGDGYPYGLFLMVVILAAWLAGRGPAIFASFIGGLSVLFVLPYIGALSHSSTLGKTRLVLFFALSILIILITSRLRAIAEKKVAAEQRLVEALDAVNVGVWDFHHANKSLFWSDKMYQLLEYDPGKVVPSIEAVLERVHPDDRDRVLSAWLQSVSELKPLTCHYRIVLREGGQRFVLAQGRHLISAGKLVRSLGTLEDVTEKQLAQVALENSERLLSASLRDAEVNLKRLKLIEEAVNAGTWEFDAKTGLSHWPAGISSLWGLPPREHVISLEEFVNRIHGDDRERVAGVVQTALMSGETYEVEFRVVWPDESVHWLSARGAVLRDETGAPTKIIGIALEVTQRHQAEKALRESEKLAATGRLAATIAHEINNPLEGVVNLIFLAKTDPKATQSTREFLAQADQELARVSHIVRQTLGFYRTSSVPRLLDASAMVEQIATLYRSKLQQKEVLVDLRTQTQPAKLFGLEGELRQVVSNLFSNAIDAVGPKGRIVVRVTKRESRTGEVVRILIADDGKGIDSSYRTKLFQPFFTTKKDVGTGLGLWISKGIIDKHSGRIRFRSSTRPGRSGTVFCIELPTNTDAAAAKSATLAG